MSDLSSLINDARPTETLLARAPFADLAGAAVGPLTDESGDIVLTDQRIILKTAAATQAIDLGGVKRVTVTRNDATDSTVDLEDADGGLSAVFTTTTAMGTEIKTAVRARAHFVSFNGANQPLRNKLGRALVVLLAVIAAALLYNLLSPASPDIDTYESAATTALEDERRLSASASGAPQQAVVNGWVARDLLLIQIAQQNALLLSLHYLTTLLVGIFVGWLVGRFLRSFSESTNNNG